MPKMKLSKRDERNLTNQYMSMYAVYNSNRHYRKAIETLESILMFATNPKTIAEVNTCIEALRRIV